MSPGLTPDEVRALQAARHKPLYLIAVLSAVVNAANLTDSKLQCADGVICGLTDAVATCDKLVSTPIPTLYSKFSNRFLMMVRAVIYKHPYVMQVRSQQKIKRIPFLKPKCFFYIIKDNIG